MIVRLALWSLADSNARGGRAVARRTRARIGKDPDVFELFDVEATIECRYLVEELSRRSLASEA